MSVSKEPSSSAFQPSSSSSQPSSSATVAKGDKPRGPGGKLLVVLTAEGSPIGLNAATFTTRSSEAVHSTVPINSKDWRTVDKSFKDDIWKKILVEKNPGVKIRRVDMWYKGHVWADGTVLESSKETYAYLNQQGSEQPPLTPTSRTEIGSTSVDPPCTTNPNANKSFEVTPMRTTSNVNPLVKLLNKEGMVVATGFVLTGERHVGICHGKKVGLGEKKVYIERVLIPDTPIYDAPQNRCNILEDIVEGGFLIWLECRLKY